MLARVALVTAALAALVVVPAAQPVAQDGFFFGFTEDIPKQIGAEAVTPAADLGAKAFRITLMWAPGQTQLTSADADGLDRAIGAAEGMKVVLAVYATAASSAPKDATARDEYCTYLASVLARYPSVKDVAIWNEPNLNFFWSPQLDAPARYLDLVARCYDVLHAARPDVNVIAPVLSSNGNDNATSTSPGEFIRKLGTAYRASGRTRPILDTVGHHGYGNGTGDRPWHQHIQTKWIAQGDWNKLMYNLWQAFSGTAQPIPGEGGVSIWYLEGGFQTSVDPEHAGAYFNGETVAVIPDFAGGEPDSPAPSETSLAPDQYTQILDAVRLAYCQPYVGAFFNFLLFDEPTLTGWQSGAYWADRTPKDSLPAFRQAIAEVNAGSVDCDALKGGRPSADFMPPSTPTGLAGTAERDPLRVVLTWQSATDDASAIGYRIYRNGAHVGTTTETTWTNASVASSTTYTYTVRAIDAAGNLGNASTAVTVTTPDVVAPTTPADVTATTGTEPTRIELRWSASTDAVGVAGYDLYRDGAFVARVTSPSYTDTAIAGYTTYGYAVVAFDAAENRSDAGAVTVATGDLTPPSAVGALSAAGRTSPLRVELAWQPATDDTGVTAYEVARDGAVVASVADTSYTDTAVASGRSYTYSVRAVDAAGNRGPQATASATAPDVVAPSAPPNLTAQALSYPQRARLTWGASTDDVGVTAYRVYRNGALIATTANRTYTDGAVSRSTWYRYDVRALDAAGNLGPASAVWIKTTNR